MKTVYGYYVDPLDYKQKCQLVSLCDEFQPYTNVSEVVFLEVIKAAASFCSSSYYPFFTDKDKRFNELLINKFMAKIKSKYYFNGLKYAKRPLTNKQYALVLKKCNVPIIRIDPKGQSHVQKELFVKIVRACRDYMRAKMSKQAEQNLFERLCVVLDALS